MLICIDPHSARPPSLSPRRHLFSPLFLSPSCQHWQRATQTLAARLVTDAAAVRQRGEKEQELKQTDRKRKMEKGRGGWVGGERAKKRGRRRGMSDTIESWPSPLCEKGTRCRIRPRPIITARWAVEGCGQRARLKNKIAWDIFRVGLQNNFILTFPFTALCTVRTQSEQLPTQPCG